VHEVSPSAILLLPQADGSQAIGWALQHGDLAALRALRRLGVPWQPTAETFGSMLQQDTCTVPALAWLLAVGCPVDWRAAQAAAEERRASHPVLADWLSGHRDVLRARIRVRRWRLSCCRMRRTGGSLTAQCPCIPVAVPA
jgi:hypothetical protein